MCFFITIGVRGERATCLEDAVSRGLAVYPVANKSILKRLPADYRTYILTSGMCSCGLFRVAATAKESTADRAAKLRRKYVKRGWSDKKIERALAQADAHQEPAEPFVGLRPDVRELLADVAEEIGDMAIVAHWYDDDLEAGKFKVLQGPTILPAALRQGGSCLAEDMIFFIRARKGAGTSPSKHAS